MLIYPPNVNSECGNKAVRLAEMASAGVEVPPFVCIPRGVMTTWLAAGADELREDLPLPTGLSEELESWAGKFPAGTAFAVRSSALAEDGSRFSFAGQFDSFLEVAPENLARRVVDCWRSAFSPAVQEYAAGSGVPLPLEMGVVVQQMADATQSGVIFTANPQGILSETVLTLGAGAGAGVAEETPVTTVYYNRPDKLYYMEKQHDSPEISRALVEQLVAAGEKLETHLGTPGDIEFAVGADGRLQFLQMRPITTLGKSSKSPVVLDNSNLVESYPGISLPLTASFAGEVYSGVFRGAARRCLPGESTVAKMEDTFCNMVASVNGRMYYQISNWYTILRHFPMQKKIIPIWQRMMGVRTPEVGGEAPATLWQKAVTSWKILATVAGVPKRIKALHREFLQVEEQFNRKFSARLGNEELKGLYDEISRRLLGVWDITLFNDMYAFIFTGLLQNRLAKAGAADAKAEANRLIGSGGELVSMGPVVRLAGLAKQVAENPELAGKLAALDTDAATEAYMADEEFGQQLQVYINAFGDRSLEELKLESETWRTSPLMLVQTILAYAEQPDSLERLLAPRSPGEQKRGITGFYTRHARIGIEGREQSRLDRTRIFGMVRQIVRAMGENLAAAGYLEGPGDVFYLKLNELFAAVENPAQGNSFAAMVSERKQRYKGFVGLPAYSRLVFDGRPFDKPAQRVQLPGSQQGETRMVGTPCAGGRVQGRVRLVTRPEDAREGGEILVTPMTDPGWVFLLASAKGVISERGSVLSHTAIIARELGVPFVVGLPGIMETLRDGMLVEMDGESGEVEIICTEQENQS